ncbi:MAG: hypothetical protein AAF358_14150 [Pseudomonadota bacterium]
MDALVFLILLAALAWWVYTKLQKLFKPFTAERASPVKKATDYSWVIARFNYADTQEREKPSSRNSSFPAWYFDEPTDRQLKKLNELGLPGTWKGVCKTLRRNSITKGMASDLIGLHYKPDENERAILRFFKKPLSGVSQTEARQLIGEIFADPQNKEKWENRPASPIEREFFRFFGLIAPKGLSTKQAKELISAHLDDESLAYEERLNRENDWDNYASMYEELTDLEFRRDEEIKKVGITVYREAVDELKRKGESVSEMDMYDVLDRIREKKPDIDK